MKSRKVLDINTLILETIGGVVSLADKVTLSKAKSSPPALSDVITTSVTSVQFKSTDTPLAAGITETTALLLPPVGVNVQFRLPPEFVDVKE